MQLSKCFLARLQDSLGNLRHIPWILWDGECKLAEYHQDRSEFHLLKLVYSNNFRACLELFTILLSMKVLYAVSTKVWAWTGSRVQLRSESHSLLMIMLSFILDIWLSWFDARVFSSFIIITFHYHANFFSCPKIKECLNLFVWEVLFDRWVL